jgi:hypothetical protein
MSFLSTAVQRVLEDGSFCYVATQTPYGPHCTPLVFGFSGGRIWLTTARGSVKATAWSRDRTVAGMVRSDGLAVTFIGRVDTYDLLDSNTWSATIAEAPQLARASLRFSRKNARFFAGYAFDARQVPLAWTPPGRVFVGIDLDRTALIDERGVAEGRSRWSGGISSASVFRRPRYGPDPFAGFPPPISGALHREGSGALGVGGSEGLVVIPARWKAYDHELLVAVATQSLSLASTEPVSPAVLTVDRPSAWRARDMVGAMFQGSAEVFEPGKLTSGARSASSLVRSIDPDAGSLVRMNAGRIVWWRGWTSGSRPIAPDPARSAG